ncbi:DNA primase [Magnetospirillum moscoviense]|uniref:DNA primase n=1 Tax=Magnetospirillum moscoviense TaxID=1437059 RepID=A0A178MU86_9PROT|nr:DNA primase [Magnetospirillum moscoviense]OAN53764.1 DNA primase [Magnetospirillum moscoviense]
MAFPPQFLDELRARVPLTGVVGRRVKLTRKGREQQGLCPFHNEKTPSFTVNEEKGFFHCFGCGAHGDAIGFEMRANHLSFTEAVEKLAAECGLEVPKATPQERQQEARRASLHDVMEAACKFFEKSLRGPAGRDGLAYLRDRGLSEETIARFRLGWAPDSREALKKALMSEATPESLLTEAGLLKKPEGDGAAFDFFRGRVMFPVTDRRGRIVAFGARTLGDGQPKYLNSPDTPLFHKGSTLYGLAHARESAREKRVVLAAEGYMDVIALHQAGFTFAVAPLGTALTEAQIEEMWRLADEPILCFDGDNAGQRAMGRAAERAVPILKPGKSLRFALLPHPEDPDSLIKAKGPAAMQSVLDQARGLFEVLFDLTVAGRPLDTPERRAAIEKDLKDKAFAIADETVRWQYLSAFRDRLREILRPQRANPGPGMGQRAQFKRRPNDPPLRAPDGRLPGAGKPRPPAGDSDPLWLKSCEIQLLALLLHQPPLLEQVCESLGETGFSDNALDNLRRGILKHLQTVHDLDSDAFCDHLRADGLTPVLDHLLDTDEYRIGRPETIIEAKQHWDRLFKRYAWKRGLANDIGQAAEKLGQDMSAGAFDRFAALKQVGSGIAEDKDDDDDDRQGF